MSTWTAALFVTPIRRSLPMLALALAPSFVASGCAASEAGAPTPTATVSGIVKTSGGAPIPGAAVSIGTATTTSGADGSFALTDLPTGSATLNTTAQTFDPRSENISLVEGSNVHDVVLTPQTLYTYGNAVAYLPPEVTEYKAAIVFLPGLKDPTTGNPLDSRGLVSGSVEANCSIWCTSYDKYMVRTRSLSLAGGDVALIGTTTLVDGSASYTTLLQTLTQLGTLSLHPELATIPIFFVGHSMGGCTAYGFTRAYPTRVAGFLTMKGACHSTAAAGGAAGVPGLFLIGALDETYRRDNITAVFEAGRAGGALWALSTDPYYHGPIIDFELMFSWIDTVLSARLPLTPGGSLRAMPDSTGWLGDRSTGAISTYACYAGTRSSAAWLPSESAAIRWQLMAGGSLVVNGC
jgi:hypothetical protein